MPATRRVVEQEPFNASTPVEALAEDVTPTPLHYVRNHFPVPQVEADAADAWRLEVTGHVAAPRTVTLADVKRLAPAKTVAVTLECAGNSRTRMTPLPPGTPWDDGAVSTARFTGVPLRALLDEVGLGEGVVELLFRGADEGEAGGARMHFDRALPLKKALDEDVLLAWEMNGAPLPPDHGFPLRLIVPGWYGVASVKWLARIEALTRPFAGYFQKDRYTFDGEQEEGAPPEPVTAMRVRSLVHAPAPYATLPAGAPVTVRGRAWGGAGGVARVDVSTDGGTSWAEATLEEAVGPHAWRGFRFEWAPAEPGDVTLLARATDADGNTQPLEVPWNRHGYGNNACVPVHVIVRAS